MYCIKIRCNTAACSKQPLYCAKLYNNFCCHATTFSPTCCNLSVTLLLGKYTAAVVLPVHIILL